MNTRTTMKSAIEQILISLGQLDAFAQSKHFALKIQNEPFMPLSIEKHDNIITVTHYYEQNGDLIPDPDMEFVDFGQNDWTPVAIQHATGHYFRAGENIGGTWRFNSKTMHFLQSFSKLWARNLLDQGFKKGRVEYAKAE